MTHRNNSLNSGFGYFLLAILPALMFYCIFTVYPVIISFYYSFTNYDGFTEIYHWVGWDNYKELFTADSLLSAAVKNNLIWAFFEIIVHNIIALCIALLLDQNIRFRNLYRSIFFLPVIMSTVAVSFIWGFIFDPNSGSLDGLLKVTGLGSWAQDWLGNSHLALYSTMFVESWKNVGFNILIFIAGLQVIPTDVLEAADMDGASKWQKFWHVTFPGLLPTTGLVLVLSANSAFRVFDVIFLLTQGGPGTATQVINLRIYLEAFSHYRMGYASAIAWVLFIFLLLFAWMQLKFTRNEENK